MHEAVGTPHVALSAHEIAALVPERLSGKLTGVQNTVLSEHAGTYAGLMRIAPGETLPEHRHRTMGHHVWVVGGSAEVFGRMMTEGSYWYVPPGDGHAPRGLHPDGCILFYVGVPER